MKVAQQEGAGDSAPQVSPAAVVGKSTEVTGDQGGAPDVPPCPPMAAAREEPMEVVDEERSEVLPIRVSHSAGPNRGTCGGGKYTGDAPHLYFPDTESLISNK